MARSRALNQLSERDIAAIDLPRVLERLERKILGADADARLWHNPYERAKTSANLEYARTMLLRLEHSFSSIKLPSRKQAAQSDLFAQRAFIKRLTDRLHDIEAHGDDDDLLFGPEDEEDILGENKPAEQQVSPSSETKTLSPSEPSALISKPTLRNRFNPPPPSSTTTTDHPPPASLLEHNDTESANLTSSLVTLAQALKASSQRFSDALDADTATLNRTTEGLEKNASGMEVAGQRMGMLRRMSEGKGWWGRMMLYAWIFGMWVAVILLVFVVPKLRF
ncbi:hypothetical protein MMC21_000080 [Puttea exsequens]|nr:hypothetical protein [Puttea exsequens]